MTDMQIPDSIEDAVLDLKGLGELITASEWQRAALVWAFTVELGKGEKPKCQDVSISDFAKLGISGLSSRPTVAKYRKAWAKAIEDGHATDIGPGDLIDLPEVEWQPYFNPPSEKLPKPTSKKEIPQPTGWNDDDWDLDKVNGSDRLMRMNDVMWSTVAGVEELGIEGEMLNRIASSIVDFANDENKVRGLARMMHSIIEFTSAYKASHRQLP